MLEAMAITFQEKFNINPIKIDVAKVLPFPMPTNT
jgi:hypothetical protein